jgi:hypothetical protein
MIVYPVPVALTQARIQLVADQTEKAPPHIINEDVLDVAAAKNEAEREALVDLKA